MNGQIWSPLMSNAQSISTATVNDETLLTHILSCPSPSIPSDVTSIKLVSQLSWPIVKHNGITLRYTAPPSRRELRTSSSAHVTGNELLTRDIFSKTRLKMLGTKVVKWHLARWKRPVGWSTIDFRCLSILLGFLLLIEFAVVNASRSGRSPSVVIQFLYGAEYPIYEITVIVYASAAAAMGISFEVYPFLIFAVVNVIMASLYCDELTVNVIFVVKLINLFAATELSYQNFRRLPKYNEAFDQSARYMVHQAFLFSATMLFVVARGLRAVYLGTTGICAYQRDTCGFNNLYQPQFKVNDSCDNTFVDYLSGREELRILRNWVLLNVAFHAVFNRALFDFADTGSVRWPLPRFILRILFVALAMSFLAVNIWPFEYHNFKIAFDVVECVLYALTIGLMIYNLISCSRRKTGDGQEEEPMQRRPAILPNH